MTRMKRLLGIGLAVVMLLSCFPLTAFAAEKLATPTDLSWGKDYSYQEQDSTNYTPFPGMISWRANRPNQGRSVVTIYNIEDTTGEPIWTDDEDPEDGYISEDFFLWMDEDGDRLPSGTYYFTVQYLGDGENYLDSDIATSDTWTYVKPSAKLPEMDIVEWVDEGGIPSCKWDPLESEMIYGYDISIGFAETLDKTPEYRSSMFVFADENPVTMEDWIVEENGEGYYYAKIRALSNDITKIQSGSWSEESAPFYLTGESIGVVERLELVDETASAEEIREGVQSISSGQLRAAMLADKDNTGVNARLMELEDSIGKVVVKVDDQVSDISKSDVSIIGALLNDAYSNVVTLDIGKPKDSHDVLPEVYNNTLAVNFSMTMDGLYDPEELEVPVKMILPIPARINPDFLVLLHYFENSDEFERIDPYIFQKDGRWYASFILDRFSDFVMTQEGSDPDVLIGDVNGDGKVTNKDRTELSRYLAKWNGYDENRIDLKAADVNGDGKVTNKDRTVLSRYLAKWAGYDTLPHQL